MLATPEVEFLESQSLRRWTPKGQTHSKGGGGFPRHRLLRVHVAFRIIEVFSDLLSRIFEDQAHASFHIFQSKHLSEYSHHWVKACRAQGPKAMSQLAAAASTLQHKISKVGRVPSNVPQRLNAMCLHQARRCMKFHLILGRYPNSLFSHIVIGRLQQQALHNQSQSYRLSLCHNIFFSATVA